MKKRIIPVCLACMMLVSMCKKDTGGVQGVIETDKMNLKSSRKARNTQSNAFVSSSTNELKGKAENRNTGTIKRVARKTKISGKRSGSPLSGTSNNRKLGGPLVKPRVDVPDVK